MATKSILHYGVRETLAPGETTPTTVPVIIDRLQPVDLSTLIENCIDRNLILGAKGTAALGIADGLAMQIYREFEKGNGVAFGSYFYGRLYLNGTVGPDEKLTDENKVNVRLMKGDGFKLSTADFTMQFNGNATAPKVEFVQNFGEGGNNMRGEVVNGAKVGAYGKNLFAAGDTLAVTFTEADATGTPSVVTVSAFNSVSAEQLTFDCPALDATKQYDVVVSRTDANGVTRKTSPKRVKVSGAPAPSGITLTGVHAPGIESPMIEPDAIICFDGTGLDAWDGETDRVDVKNNRAAEAEWSSVGEITIEYEDGMLKLSEGVWATLAEFSISTPGSEPRFRVTIGGSSAEIVATVAEP